MASERKEVFLSSEGWRIVSQVKTVGIMAYALFASGTEINPQMNRTALLNDQLLVPLADGEAGEAERAPKRRRLWGESWAWRRQVESAERTGRGSPAWWSSARGATRCRPVPDMSFEGELDVGDQLIAD